MKLQGWNLTIGIALCLAVCDALLLAVVGTDEASVPHRAPARPRARASPPPPSQPAPPSPIASRTAHPTPQHFATTPHAHPT